MRAETHSDTNLGLFAFGAGLVMFLSVMMGIGAFWGYRDRFPAPEVEATLRSDALPIGESRVALACSDNSKRAPVRLCVALNEAARPDARTLWKGASYEERKDCYVSVGAYSDGLLSLAQCLAYGPSSEALATTETFPVTRRSVELSCLRVGGDVEGCIGANLGAVVEPRWAKATEATRARCVDGIYRTTHNARLRIHLCLGDSA